MKKRKLRTVGSELFVLVRHVWDVVRIDKYLDIEKLTAPGGDHPGYIGWVPVSRVLTQKRSDFDKIRYIL